ncbi:MAG: S1 RNA-binding domain-containing protein [Clostridiales bacterium]|nr:S1 RNA-binding domain-containing protein [Clostridiales bacterium]
MVGMKNNDYPPEGMQIGTMRVREYCRSYATLEKALENGVILEGKAIRCDENHNLHVRLPGGITGIIPYSECTDDNVREGSREIAVISRVGKTVCFKVAEINCDTVTLSRKAAQRECMDNCISFYEPGDIIDAVVTHMEPFGAFCDVGCGIVSLLPIDAMSVSRISHPKDRFYTGQKIKAVVKTSCDCDGRISLSHKELLGTWEENALKFPAGQAVTGIVRSIEKYGIFVELSPNLAGLAEYREGLEAGDWVSVYIKSVIPQKMKVKLVIIDKAEREKPDFTYEYYYTSGRLCRWRYSPEVSPKVVETVFQNTKSNWIP